MYVQKGIRAWHRVAHLLLLQQQLSAAAKLIGRLLQLAAGRRPPATNSAQLKLRAAAEGFQCSAPSYEEPVAAAASASSAAAAAAAAATGLNSSEELWDLPMPPTSAPGAPSPHLLSSTAASAAAAAGGAGGRGAAATAAAAAGVICAPAAVLDLLVLLAKVLIARGEPSKALCLTKWVRYYAKEVKLEEDNSFITACLLYSYILVECPALLRIAEIDDSKINSCWGERDILQTLPEETTAANHSAVWRRIALLRKEALLQLSSSSNSSSSKYGFLLNPEASLRGPYPQDAAAAADSAAAAAATTADNNHQKTNKQNRPLLLQQHEVEVAELWRSLTLPPLHHLIREEERSSSPAAAAASAAAAATAATLNLHDAKNEQKAVLLLEFAEALKHQTPQTAAAYLQAVCSTGDTLRSIGEPNPFLCVRVWLHQLHAFRLQLEQQQQQQKLLLLQQHLLLQRAAATARAAAPAAAAAAASPEGERGEGVCGSVEEIITEQMLQYFKTVMRILIFIDKYCCCSLHLLRELFSEALLLAVLMLAISKQLAAAEAAAASDAAPPAAAAAAAAVGGGGGEKSGSGSLLARVLFRGIHLCMLCLCLTERLRQQSAFTLNKTTKEMQMQNTKCPRPLLRLFASLIRSFTMERNALNLSNEGKHKEKQRKTGCLRGVCTPQINSRHCTRLLTAPAPSPFAAAAAAAAPAAAAAAGMFV